MMASHGFRPLKRVGILAFIGALIISLFMLGTSTTSNASVHPRLDGQSKGNDVWYGNYNGPGAERWYCGDPTLGGPGFSAPSSVDINWGAKQWSTSWKTKNGTAMSAVNVQRLAYIMSTHAHTSNNQKAAEASWAIRDMVGKGAANATPGGAGLKSAGEEIIADARRFAGPYTISPTVVKINNDKYQIHNLRPVSQAGNELTGYPGTVTLTGPAEFANGTKVANADVSSRTINVTGPGAIEVVSTFTELPHHKLRWRKPGISGVQRVLVAGEKDEATGKVSIQGQEERPIFEFSALDVKTITSQAIGKPGDVIVDHIDIRPTTPAGNGYSGTVTGGLYRVGTNDRVSSEISFNVSGLNSTTPKRYTSSSAVIPVEAEADDEFIWRWDFPAWSGTYNGAPVTIAAFRTEDFDEAEITTINLDSFIPSIRTQISDQSASPGDTVTDRAWFTGLAYRPEIVIPDSDPDDGVDDSYTILADGFRGTVTAHLYTWPMVDADDDPVATVTYDIDATDESRFETAPDGSRQSRQSDPFMSPPVTIPDDAPPGGKFTWVQSLDAWDDDDSGLTQVEVRTPAGLPEETTTMPRQQPTYVTQVNEQVLTIGEPLNDTISVSGVYSGSPIRVNWELYGPYETHPELAPTCDVDKRVDRGQLVIEEDGDYVTPDVYVTEPGYYTYVEWNFWTDVHFGYRTQCGEVSETALVKGGPQYVTQISSAESIVGEQIHDTITVEGLLDDKSLDIHWELYGPYEQHPELTDFCEGDPYASGTVTATTNGDVVTQDVTLEHKGYFTYVEWHEEDPNYYGHRTQCGIAEETTLTLGQPRYTTVVSEQEVVVGSTIFDNVLVEGLNSDEELDINWALYGPYDEKPPAPDPLMSEEPLRCEGEPYETGTITATGNGTIQTQPVEISDPGWFTYVEWHEDEELNSGHSTECGEEPETFFAQAAPPVAPPIERTGGSLALALQVLGGLIAVAGISMVVVRRRRNAE